VSLTAPILMRTSERSSLKHCPQQWEWAWRHGLKANSVATALWFGQGIHQALAEWYKPGFVRGPDHPAKTWLEFCASEERYIRDAGGQPDEAKWVDARDLGTAMMMAYVEEFVLDPTWDVIATEQAFQIRIRTPLAPTGFIIFSGTFDGVFRDTKDGSLWLMEHKTAAGFPNIGFLELDDQASGYFLAAEITLRHKGLIGEDEHLAGIMYNYLRKALPDDRPRNAEGLALNMNGTVSKRQDTQRFMRYPVWRSIEQRLRTRESIINDFALSMKYRTGELAVTKTPTKDCVWCPFFQMCQLHESDADWKEFRDAMFTRRDPYADHRLALKSA
jgi:hypothetical protein